jgi:hypothetical protein
LCLETPNATLRAYSPVWTVYLVKSDERLAGGLSVQRIATCETQTELSDAPSSTWETHRPHAATRRMSTTFFDCVSVTPISPKGARRTMASQARTDSILQHIVVNATSSVRLSHTETPLEYLRLGDAFNVMLCGFAIMRLSHSRNPSSGCISLSQGIGIGSGTETKSTSLF